MLQASLLIVDDEPTIRKSLTYFFGEKGCDAFSARNGHEGVRLAEERQPDVVITDLKLPDLSGMQVLERVRAASPEAAVVMLTAYGSIAGAVEAVRAGAFEYLTKPVDLGELELVVQRALELQRLKKENRLLRRISSAPGVSRLIGSSPQVHKLTLMVNLLAENADTTVLVEGESGTGKEVLARAIHAASPRGERPFVEINCAGLSETLLESELFGHERGAFTDAKAMKRGLMEVAGGGTLFLDEIGELSLSLQPKLLRVIETRTFRRVGGTRDIKADVRFIAATNRDLSEMVRRREFREDLYYRLRVMPLTAPPLRERGKDVLVLARHFLSSPEIGARRRVTGISKSCEERLLAYHWPGNVRELRNVIERAAILSDGPLIEPDHLPWELTAQAGQSGQAGGPGAADAPLSLEEAERAHILLVLGQSRGNRSEAARTLGISRSTLISKIKRYGLL